MAGRPEWGHEFHRDLLNKTAEQCDRDRAHDSRSRRVKSVTVEELCEGDDASQDMNDFNVADEPWNINFLSDHSKNVGETMRKDVWLSLKQAVRDVWETVPDEDKAKILNCKVDCTEQCAAKDVTSSVPSKTCSVNVTEIIGAELTDDASDEGTQELEAHRTIQEFNETKGQAHPGDLRRMLGSQKANTPTQSTSGMSF